MYFCIRIQNKGFTYKIGFRNNLDFVIVFNVNQDDVKSS
jgi:hypothetical protein